MMPKLAPPTDWEPFDQLEFEGWSKGARGLCGAKDCRKPAVWMRFKEFHGMTSFMLRGRRWPVQSQARCDVHRRRVDEIEGRG